MPDIHQIATLTSEGQITSVRQLLGLDTGGKIAFDARAGEVVVSPIEAIHEDPATDASLGLWKLISKAGETSSRCPKTWAGACSPTWDTV